MKMDGHDRVVLPFKKYGFEYSGMGPEFLAVTGILAPGAILRRATNIITQACGDLFGEPQDA